MNPLLKSNSLTFEIELLEIYSNWLFDKSSVLSAPNVLFLKEVNLFDFSYNVVKSGNVQSLND